jgi:hypothetical protein
MICVGVTASEDDSAHGLMKGGPIIEHGPSGYATDAARLLCQMHLCFCFSFLSQGFPGMLEACRFPGRQSSSPLREVKRICGAHCCWCDAKIEIGMGPKMVHATADTRCGEHGESRMVRPLCTNRMLPLE